MACLASVADAQRTLKSIGRDLEYGVRDILHVQRQVIRFVMTCFCDRQRFTIEMRAGGRDL